MSLMGGSRVYSVRCRACRAGLCCRLGHCIVRLPIAIVSGFTTGQNGQILKLISPSSIDMLIEWICISTPLFVSVVWCIDVDVVVFYLAVFVSGLWCSLRTCEIISVFS